MLLIKTYTRSLSNGIYFAQKYSGASSDKTVLTRMVTVQLSWRCGRCDVDLQLIVTRNAVASKANQRGVRIPPVLLVLIKTDPKWSGYIGVSTPYVISLVLFKIRHLRTGVRDATLPEKHCLPESKWLDIRVIQCVQTFKIRMWSS